VILLVTPCTDWYLVFTDNPDAFLRLLVPLAAFFAAAFPDRPLIAVALRRIEAASWTRAAKTEFAAAD
jgi:hypothetical protein